MDYYKECLIAALEEMRINVPDDDILSIGVRVIEGGIENYGTSMGHDCIPNYIEQENEKLKLELKRERDKKGCPHCRGDGRIEYTVGTSHYSSSECDKCNGEGKI